MIINKTELNESSAFCVQRIDINLIINKRVKFTFFLRSISTNGMKRNEMTLKYLEILHAHRIFLFVILCRRGVKLTLLKKKKNSCLI